MIKSDDTTGKKAERAKQTVEDSKFWICCHIMAGFGDFFFLPAQSWIQVDQGRRAPLMSNQLTKWLVLLKSIEHDPSHYFRQTINYGYDNEVTSESIESMIQKFASTAQVFLQKYFGAWLEAPLTLAGIDDPQTARALLPDIMEHPDKYNLHGFLNQQVFDEFLEYSDKQDKLTHEVYPNLFSWFLKVFGSCVIHNIDCERAFSLMRYFVRTKQSADTTLLSFLIQNSLDPDPDDIHSVDYVQGLLSENINDLEGQEVKDMITDLLNSWKAPEQDSLERAITLSTEQLFKHEFAKVKPVQQIQSHEERSEKDVSMVQVDDIFKAVNIASAVLLLGMETLSAKIAAIMNTYCRFVNRQAVLNSCMEMTHPTDVLYNFETLIEAATY